LNKVILVAVHLLGGTLNSRKIELRSRIDEFPKTNDKNKQELLWTDYRIAERQSELLGIITKTLDDLKPYISNER
jgi:hypothetical protein